MLDENGYCVMCGYSEGNGDFSEDSDDSEGEFGGSTGEDEFIKVPGIEIPEDFVEIAPIG